MRATRISVFFSGIAFRFPGRLTSSCLGQILTRLICGLTLSLLILAGPAAAQGDTPPVRLALVIGNGDYEGGWGKLSNPVRDAQLVATALTAAGFKVLPPAINLPKARLLERLAQFRALADALPENSIAWIYYSGHGLQANGENFLIPLGARTPVAADALAPDQREDWMAREYVTVSTILQQFGRTRATKSHVANVLILDACRENPWDKRTKGASSSKGLADLPNVANSLIAFAAAPGTPAFDGEGVNSPYAIALVQQLANRRIPLELLFNRITTSVLKLTANSQRPDYRVGLSGFYCLETCDDSGLGGGGPPRTAVSGPRDSDPLAKVPVCKYCIDTVPIMSGGKLLKVGRTQVTLAQWRACVADLACPQRGSDSDNSDLPVTKVSWIDASAFADWISGRTDRTYRLMHSDEWDQLVQANETTGGFPSRRLPTVSTLSPGKAGILGLGVTVEWTGTCSDTANPCRTRIARGTAPDSPGGNPTATLAYQETASGALLSFRLIEDE